MRSVGFAIMEAIYDTMGNNTWSWRLSMRVLPISMWWLIFLEVYVLCMFVDGVQRVCIQIKNAIYFIIFDVYRNRDFLLWFL